LYSFISINDLSNFVRIIPFQNQKKLCEIYNIFDLLVFPSQRLGESLGLVAVEALTCGLPVIASDIAAPSFFIKDNYNGFKFPVGDAKILINKILFALMKNNLTFLNKGALESAKAFNSNNCREILKEVFN
jgi:glycosyltransferase involved in cell wall biosynthesis